MSVIRKLYKSQCWNTYSNVIGYPSDVISYRSDVVDLVYSIEELAAQHGYTLGRWDTSGHTSWDKTITYALHHGERATSSYQQKGVLALIKLGHVEGTSKRCEAYRQLLWLQQKLQKNTVAMEEKVIR